MKKILQSVLVGVGSVIALAVPASAQASTCTVQNTGSGSVNVCTFSNQNTTVFFCTNSATVNNSNVQIGSSGTTSVTGNGSGGSASSGNVSNQTATSAALTLGCGTVAAAPTTPTTPKPVTPAATTPQEGGGKGAGAPAPAAAPVTALPQTGVTTPAESALSVLAVVSALGAALGATYRRAQRL